MAQPKYLSVDPTLLNPNPWNSNIVSPENDRKLIESIKRNGLFKPIIVREIAVEGKGVYEIIGGEHRWQAAMAAGLKEVPIVTLGAIDERRAKEISVLDNSRYGDDDAISLAEILKEIGSTEELQDFLPLGDADLTDLFSTSNIALDDLELDEKFEIDPQDTPEPKIERPPKTHTVMRFKVSMKDAERITKLIARTQGNYGFTAEDDLTNAGDALVHLLFQSSGSDD